MLRFSFELDNGINQRSCIRTKPKRPLRVDDVKFSDYSHAEAKFIVK